MRKLSSNYSVTYEIKDKDDKILEKQRNYNCYSVLYDKGINIKNKLILSKFLAEETSVYSKIYIKRLAKICDLKLRFIDEDSIELIGFKDKFHIKLFTTLFRILFEVHPGYGNCDYKKKTVDFLNYYVKKKNNSGYKDMLERLIYNYQKSEMFQGFGHGITRDKSQIILVKNINDLRNWNSEKYNQDMQSFFSNKN